MPPKVRNEAARSAMEPPGRVGGSSGQPVRAMTPLMPMAMVL